MARSLLVLSGGHPYEEEPFDELIHSLGDWAVTHLVHPVAEEEVAAGAADEADALLFYDMGGYTFGDGRVETRPPSAAFRDAIARRFASGRGAVAMHHALAGWAEWPQWHEWLGGRFLYQPGEHRGHIRQDSGYRHDVEYTAEALAPDHPVLDGVPHRFSLTDELYLAEVNEADVIPLIRADHVFVRDNFYSAAQAVAGRMFSNENWDHAEGSNLVAWQSRTCPAPLVYLQFGDGPATYCDQHVRRLVANALAFTAGDART